MKNKRKADREVTINDVFDTELTPTDYGFIMTGDGTLKAVFVPRDMDEYAGIPESVQQVFVLFGIKEPESVTVHSIH